METGAADNEDPTIAEDKLRGVKEIAAFIGEDERRTYYLLENGSIPAGKLGRRSWVASKRALRAHFERIAAGGAQ